METTIRRFAVLMLLGFWQGGFLFYTSVVVPLGQKVLGSDLQQGFVTQQVTDSLNWAGLATLPLLAWDLVRGDKRSWLGWGRWACWAGLAATLVGLIWLHPRMDVLLDPENLDVLDRRAFRILHRIYLWLCTIQWFFGVAFLGLTVAAWRREDRHTGKAPLAIRFHTRKGCHLCEEAYALLREWEKKDRVAIEVIDIDGDPQLTARYGEMIPVIEIDGKPRLWGKVNPVLLRRLMEGGGSGA